MRELRLGDDLDDYCAKCKRMTNHSILSLVETRPGKVRCRTCYAEQTFRDGVPPPSKRDLKKAELFNAVLGNIAPQAAEAAPASKGKKKD